MNEPRRRAGPEATTERGLLEMRTMTKPRRKTPTFPLRTASALVLPALTWACTVNPPSAADDASDVSGIGNVDGDASTGMPSGVARTEGDTTTTSTPTTAATTGEMTSSTTLGSAGETVVDDGFDDDSIRFDVASMIDVYVGPQPVECDGLIATMRDMQDTHPDFEVYTGNQAYVELVLPTLGPDNTPVLNPDYDGAPMITTEESFFEWYHDVPDVNEAFTIELPLAEDTPGIFIFDSDAFFPLDDLGFGNEGRTHNYHFTTEVHTSFTYSGGEVFTFRGDDDLWMFVNGQLVIDLGGLHPVLSGSVEMDTLGLTLGETYPMDIFHAERHTSHSNFRIETTIDCFIAPAPEG